MTLGAESANTLSDRMPDVARGRGAWTPGQRARIAGDPDLEAEWRLVQAAAALGREVETEFNAARTAEVLIARLRAAHAAPIEGARVATSRRRWYLGAGLAAAAALLLLVRSAPETVSPAGPPPSAAGFTIQLAELDELGASELESLLNYVNVGLTPADAAIDAPALGELTDDQLDHLARTLEDIS
ncbi:MAG: hypothetical protein ACOY71_08345 [Gemmatimonadota bacterium]